MKKIFTTTIATIAAIVLSTVTAFAGSGEPCYCYEWNGDGSQICNDDCECYCHELDLEEPWEDAIPADEFEWEDSIPVDDEFDDGPCYCYEWDGDFARLCNDDCECYCHSELDWEEVTPIDDEFEWEEATPVDDEFEWEELFSLLQTLAENNTHLFMVIAW